MSNLNAFLTMISVSEGTASIGDNGYNVLVGSTPRQPLLFGSYHDHPRVAIALSSTLKSTAAGRYQILARYYDAYRVLLNLPDFSPQSQDLIATQMIRERKALPDIEAGRIDQAIRKCSNIWASFPGAGYGQRERPIADLRAAYIRAGGVTVA
jgi:muramidase (phage lysozyme)